MSLRGSLAVAAYSLAGGAFRWSAEEPLTQFWWTLTSLRIGLCVVLERLIGTYPRLRIALTAALLVEAYTHNVRGRIPTDKISKGLAVVTGATSGIGFQTCVLLCERGVNVVVPARTLEKAKATAALINATARGPGVARASQVPLELTNVASVTVFGASLQKEPLTLLVLNAGVMMPRYMVTKDGAEQTIAANHLGHFQLALLVAPHMSTDARVIVVSSALHRKAARFHDGAERLLDFRGSPNKHRLFDAYAISKLQNVLFAACFAARHPGVACVACHPGFVYTSVTRHLPFWIRLAHVVAVPFWVLFQKTPRTGAHCSLHCCLSPQFSAAVLQGESRFVADCRAESPAYPPRARELAEALWRRSEAYVRGEL